MLIKFTVVLIAGLITGAINAIGGGGILIAFPVLLIFGIPAITANATTNIVTFAGNITASLGYRKQIKSLPKSYLLLLIPCILGAFIGAYILKKTSNNDFELFAPILIIGAVLLFAYQPYLHSRIYRDRMSPIAMGGPKPWVYIVVFPLAIYGGYFGAGFGLVMLAILSLTRLTSIHQMNGLKNLTGIAVSLASIIILFNSNLINWRYGMIMAIGTAVGGYIGARTAQRFSSKAIRIFIIIVGIATSIYLTVIALK